MPQLEVEASGTRPGGNKHFAANWRGYIRATFRAARRRGCRQRCRWHSKTVTRPKPRPLLLTNDVGAIDASLLARKCQMNFV